ncbi:hypothetical protein HCZ23_13200 [Celeribacter sp. HF31]|uniref:hypothetical protein n=1 Tax=Celeribacter sp. HF31 TaxID=2721558 RepID=UPI0014319D10|nr:hypothetical protein [Celeribacter sp. HF31]NIY80417.1 hypothetical protein [Celeribacter sp. HF31]
MEFKIDPAFLQWPFIEKLANNDLSRIIGIIPLVGYIILFSDEISGLISFNAIAGVEANHASPFWLSGLVKMRLVFFGSFALLISNMLFRLMSPKVLEISKNDIAFSSQVLETYTVAELKEIENAVYSDRWQERLEIFWVIIGMTRQKKPQVSGYRPDVRRDMINKHSDYIRLLAREWWVGEMHSHKVARIASLFFAITGYLMLTIPTLDICQAVLRDIVANI